MARALRIPLLVLYGGNDIYETAPQVPAFSIPGVAAWLLEDSGHLPWLQDPARFREVISDFYRIDAGLGFD